MENSDNDKMTSYNVVEEFISETDNQALIAAVPLAEAEFTKFRNVMPLLVKSLKTKETVTKGLKDESELALEKMAKELVRLGSKASVVAENAGSLDLAKKIDHTMSYLTKGSMNQAQTRAQTWRDALDANKNPGILSNISAAEIAVVDDLIDDFAKKCVKPKAAIKGKKVEGTDQVHGYIVKIDKALDNAYKLLFGEYSVTNPIFVAGLAKAMEVDHSAIRHTGIFVFASYENPPEGLQDNVINNMQIKLVEPNLVAHTNMFGIGGISGVAPDGYTLEFSGANLVTQTHMISLKRGKMLHLEAVMKRV